jgi:hypothetical protein
MHHVTEIKQPDVQAIYWLASELHAVRTRSNQTTAPTPVLIATVKCIIRQAKLSIKGSAFLTIAGCTTCHNFEAKIIAHRYDL